MGNTPVVFRDNMTVELIKSSASDNDVIWAARVSTLGEQTLQEANLTGEQAKEAAKEKQGLINYLLRERHTSPFEHSVYTFYIEAPIFVFRELMRHRTASYNEASGRYKQLSAEFYIPSPERNLIQVGKTGHYQFEKGTPEQYALVVEETKKANKTAYNTYETMLNAGIAREVARGVLPVNIYSQAYMTINMRNLMHLLSLRTINENANIKSYPQREIEMVAEQMETFFAEKNPIVYEAFNKYGRNM